MNDEEVRTDRLGCTRGTGTGMCVTQALADTFVSLRVSTVRLAARLSHPVARHGQDLPAAIPVVVLVDNPGYPPQGVPYGGAGAQRPMGGGGGGGGNMMMAAGAGMLGGMMLGEVFK